MTNGDKMRQMSDERLAKYLMKLVKNFIVEHVCPPFEWWLKWLKSKEKKIEMKKYIDVDKLIEFANNHIAGIDANDIARFPRADVQEVKYGEWVYGKYDIPFCHCSECGYEPQERTPYCPVCGAKMDEEEV